MKNDRLEILSDKVRNGISVDFFEALEVIEYQSKFKKVSFYEKILNCFNLKKLLKIKES